MVPRRLVFARNFRGLNQKELAERINIDGKNINSKLSKYENGESQPKFEFVIEIARVLDFPVEFFYAEYDYMADAILSIYQNRLDSQKNPYHSAVKEVENLRNELNFKNKYISIIKGLVEKIDE